MTGEEAAGPEAVASETSTSEESAPGESAPETSAEQAPSMTEMLLQLGRDVGVLILRETQLAATRNMPVVRRALRDAAAMLIAVVAFLTAFAFANVAAIDELSTLMRGWLAALLLCGGWLVVGVLLALALWLRARRVAGRREQGLRGLEQARDEAEAEVRETLGRLAPAITVEIASASMGMAGDTMGGMVDLGGGILEASDDIVEDIADDIPGGGVVNQVWDVVLLPGRIGVKVATTVLRRGDARNSDASGNSHGPG